MNKDRLTLALEPECAALYCLSLDNDQMAEYCDSIDQPEELETYLILDIGAGTVDITAQVRVRSKKVLAFDCATASDGAAGSNNTTAFDGATASDDTTCSNSALNDSDKASDFDYYKVIVPPIGNEYGGMKVNENFSCFLQKIVQDPGFSKFLAKVNANQAIMRKIIYHDFEEIKIAFGDKATWMHNSSMEAERESQEHTNKPSRLKLEHKFVQFYTEDAIREGIKKLGDPRVKLREDDDILEMSHSKMEEFFQPVLEGIHTCITTALQQLAEHDIDVVYVAGGFGGCQYVYTWLKNTIFMHTNDRRKMQLLVPADHDLAVSHGAVLYCRNPGVVRARKVDGFYGIECLTSFKYGVHKESYAWFSPDNGKKFCQYIFKCFVKNGEEIKADDVFLATLVPLRQSDRVTIIPFYYSTNSSVQYTTDANTKRIGSIELAVPNPNNIPREDREMEITMCFSSTEIKASARVKYLPESPAVKTVLDFL